LVKLQTGVYFFYQRAGVSFQLNFECRSEIFLIQVNWKSARNFCLQNGMDLAIIETAEEAKQVADAALRKSGKFSTEKG